MSPRVDVNSWAEWAHLVVAVVRFPGDVDGVFDALVGWTTAGVKLDRSVGSGALFLGNTGNVEDDVNLRDVNRLVVRALDRS